MLAFLQRQFPKSKNDNYKYLNSKEEIPEKSMQNIFPDRTFYGICINGGGYLYTCVRTYRIAWFAYVYVYVTEGKYNRNSL